MMPSCISLRFKKTYETLSQAIRQLSRPSSAKNPKAVYVVDGQNTQQKRKRPCQCGAFTLQNKMRHRMCLRFSSGRYSVNCDNNLPFQVSPLMLRLRLDLTIRVQYSVLNPGNAMKMFYRLAKISSSVISSHHAMYISFSSASVSLAN